MKQEILACKSCIQSKFWYGFGLSSFKSVCESCGKNRKCIIVSIDKLIKHK
jgi:hypothetical protein